MHLGLLRLYSLWEIVFLSATGSRTLDFGYRRYSRPSLATAGLRAWSNAFLTNIFYVIAEHFSRWKYNRVMLGNGMFHRRTWSVVAPVVTWSDNVASVQPAVVQFNWYSWWTESKRSRTSSSRQTDQ